MGFEHCSHWNQFPNRHNSHRRSLVYIESADYPTKRMLDDESNQEMLDSSHQIGRSSTLMERWWLTRERDVVQRCPEFFPRSKEEISYLQKLRHPCLVSFVGFARDAGQEQSQMGMGNSWSPLDLHFSWSASRWNTTLRHGSDNDLQVLDFHQNSSCKPDRCSLSWSLCLADPCRRFSSPRRRFFRSTAQE